MTDEKITISRKQFDVAAMACGKVVPAQETAPEARQLLWRALVEESKKREPVEAWVVENADRERVSIWDAESKDRALEHLKNYRGGRVFLMREVIEETPRDKPRRRFE